MIVVNIGEIQVRHVTDYLIRQRKYERTTELERCTLKVIYSIPVLQIWRVAANIE
jgi:hypothetical protein